MDDLARRKRALEHYRGFVFRWQKWPELSAEWDHDHCKACWARFAARPEEWSDKVRTEGYVTCGPAQNLASRLPFLQATELCRRRLREDSNSTGFAANVSNLCARIWNSSSIQTIPNGSRRVY